MVNYDEWAKGGNILCEIQWYITFITTRRFIPFEPSFTHWGDSTVDFSSALYLHIVSILSGLQEQVEGPALRKLDEYEMYDMHDASLM